MEDINTRIAHTLILAALLIAAFVFNDWQDVNLLWGAVIATAAYLIASIISWTLCSRMYLTTIFAALFVKKLRLSCSYLYKIEIDDKYLLIKSRKHGKFQPVGGNFKRNKYSTNFLEKIELHKDDRFTNGNRSSDDLRLFIRGCNLQKYLKWYNASEKQREVSYDREFYEELVESGYLPNDLFPYPQIDFRKQIVTPVRYSEHLDCKEVHIYDIVELKPTPQQDEYLRKLMSKGNTEQFVWVDTGTIRRRGYERSTQSSRIEITDHAKEILV
ncbi:hypothetical protein [Draconibacterium orientale]|uniref:SMODS-associated NUDIX domain-containing protein n=1 Tax=Draconibacterium orientale TaxID=1168034 RepID=UPI0029BFE2C8|nr:hypothetical protein [Draconibacterium orientale]